MFDPLLSPHPHRWMADKPFFKKIKLELRYFTRNEVPPVGLLLLTRLILIELNLAESDNQRNGRLILTNCCGS